MNDIFPRLIVGLGNPGAEYRDTRHNLGFMVLDALASELAVNYWKSGSEALVASISLPASILVKQHVGTEQSADQPADQSADQSASPDVDDRKLTLAKPLAFMNLSGRPVKGLLKQTKLTAQRLLVVHDDMDLPAGALKLKFGGGHGGHNGLRSINAAIGPDYARLRIGIGRPPGRMEASSYVLQRLKDQTLEEFQSQALAAVRIILDCLGQGLAHAMNQYNGSD